MSERSHLFLYSTATWIAYAIGREFYNDKHYVWCTPYFEADHLPDLLNLPPTSCPKEIYISLSEEVLRGDRHSAKIKSIRRGIRKGARAKLESGEIDDVTYLHILDIIANAETRDFKPLLYVIAYPLVEDLLVPVDPKHKAHLMSPEYLIEELPRDTFEVLDFQ